MEGTVLINVYLRPCVIYGFKGAEFNEETPNFRTGLQGDGLYGISLNSVNKHGNDSYTLLPQKLALVQQVL